MTNEQLIRQYYDGDEAALEKLYYKNNGLIRGIAKEAAAEFNCLMVDEHHPNQFSAYTKTILDDLCGAAGLEPACCCGLPCPRRGVVHDLEHYL